MWVLHSEMTLRIIRHHYMKECGCYTQRWIWGSSNTTTWRNVGVALRDDSEDHPTPQHEGMWMLHSEMTLRIIQRHNINKYGCCTQRWLRGSSNATTWRNVGVALRDDSEDHPPPQHEEMWVFHSEMTLRIIQHQRLGGFSAPLDITQSYRSS